jgi:hypothetical protein
MVIGQWPGSAVDLQSYNDVVMRNATCEVTVAGQDEPIGPEPPPTAGCGDSMSDPEDTVAAWTVERVEQQRGSYV